MRFGKRGNNCSMSVRTLELRDAEREYLYALLWYEGRSFSAAEKFEGEFDRGVRNIQDFLPLDSLHCGMQNTYSSQVSVYHRLLNS